MCSNKRIPLENLQQTLRKYELLEPFEKFFEKESQDWIMRSQHEALRTRCMELYNYSTVDYSDPVVIELAKQIREFDYERFKEEVKEWCMFYLTSSIEKFENSRNFSDGIWRVTEGLQKEGFFQVFLSSTTIVDEMHTNDVRETLQMAVIQQHCDKLFE